MSRKAIYITIAISVLIVTLIGIFLLTRGAQNTGSPTTFNFFGLGGATTQTPLSDTNVVQTTEGNSGIFKISDGPISGATFIQSSNPTTTLARYVMASNGHIVDLAVDVPGAAPRPASNTTIPGVVSVLWAKKGGAAITQYVDSDILKSVYVELQSASSTSAAATPARIQFLPNSIISLAVSPDGNSVAYLLPTTAGTDGYIANADGTNAKKLFSLPLSQILLTWPSAGTLLAQTKSAAALPSIAFGVNAKTGAVTSLLQTNGLSVSASQDFSKLLYQTNNSSNITYTSYIHDVATGKDTLLSFEPVPEKCIWVGIYVRLYCALSTSYTSNYIDRWHQGLVHSSDTIFSYTFPSWEPEPVASPGNGNSAPKAPIEQLGVSSDGKYLWFITRGDQSLWGVRLTN